MAGRLLACPGRARPAMACARGRPGGRTHGPGRPIGGRAPGCPDARRDPRRRAPPEHRLLRLDRQAGGSGRAASDRTVQGSRGPGGRGRRKRGRPDEREMARFGRSAPASRDRPPGEPAGRRGETRVPVSRRSAVRHAARRLLPRPGWRGACPQSCLAPADQRARAPGAQRRPQRRPWGAARRRDRLRRRCGRTGPGGRLHCT